jgi:hypothetical protein
MTNLSNRITSRLRLPTRGHGFLRAKKVRLWQNTKKIIVRLTEKRRGPEEPDHGLCVMGRDGYERFGKIVL